MATDMHIEVDALGHGRPRNPPQGGFLFYPACNASPGTPGCMLPKTVTASIHGNDTGRMSGTLGFQATVSFTLRASGKL
jgi:hypothetical protein